MVKQRKPTRKELGEYGKLCSVALSRLVSLPLDIELDPFEIPAEVTKTRIFGAYVHVKSSADVGTVDVPSKVVIKQYIPGVIGTSEDRDLTEIDFLREKTILDLDIGLTSPQGKTRIYPLLYSKGDLGDSGLVILREYIPGKNIEDIAREQIKKGEAKWEKSPGTPHISDALYPLALLHAKTPDIRKALEEKFLLRVGMTPALISEDRARRSVIYVDTLLKALGKKLDDKDKKRLKEAFFEFDRKFISREELLSIVDGELDVFPHHAMVDRIPDAGAVEVGGFVRDLAVYSAPVFMDYWGKPENMPVMVCNTYLNIANPLRENLRYDRIGSSNEVTQVGTFAASVLGNLRTASSIVHYCGGDENYPAGKQTGLVLANFFTFLDSFIGIDKKNSKEAKTIEEILSRDLRTHEYKIVNSPTKKKNTNRDQPVSLREVATGAGAIVGLYGVLHRLTK